MTDSQGRRANEHGGKNIKAVADMLLAHRFEEVGPLPVNAARPEPLKSFGEAIREALLLSRPRRVFAGDVVVCRGIHGGPFNAHFLAWREGWPDALAVMCKAQHTSGSAVEKLEYLYANVHECFPCRALILLDGTAFTPPVLARARHWVARSNGKIARIFEGLSDLRCWLTDGSAYPPEPAPVLALA
jgi:hypothetical protein